MANFTISVANSIRSFGPAPSDKWGTGTPYNFTWGTSKWGEGTEDLQTAIEKFHSESVVLADSIATSFFLSVILSGSIPVLSETVSEGLSDGGGWNYVFVGPSTDAESRTRASYTAAGASVPSYTCGATAALTWSVG